MKREKKNNSSIKKKEKRIAPNGKPLNANRLYICL